MAKIKHPGPVISPEDDPYRSLEQIDCEENLHWVDRESDRTITAFMHEPKAQELYQAALEILDNDAKLALPSLHGDFIYNFWQDAEHEYGLWRRSPKAAYVGAAPVWETLLDVDALNAAEDAHWVFKGAELLYPDDDVALISLSPGGGDAVVVREFNILARSFVADGFITDLGKNQAVWVDRDTLFLAADWGPESLTLAGYPRTIRKWQRGQKFSECREIHHCDIENTGVWVSYKRSTNSVFVEKSLTFWEHQLSYLVNADPALVSEESSWQTLSVPDSAEKNIYGQWLLLQLRYDWENEDICYSAGSILVAKISEIVQNQAEWKLIYAPDGTGGVESIHFTQNYVVISVLSQIVTEIRIYDPAQAWEYQRMLGLPENATMEVLSTQEFHDDEIFVLVSSFLQPPALFYGETPQKVRKIYTSPEFFSSKGLITRQFFAMSDDGTHIPYFAIGTADALSGNVSSPCLLYGYGGFEVSETPNYNGILGKLWLEAGGVYIQANIRGGGEFGPAWHTVALKENRERCYEDFSSIAQDVVARGITSPEQLGIWGGSNGGLLMGVMYTHYPELFSAIVCSVPLLDMYRYHKLLAGASWIGEYGNPETDDWSFIGRYSPYQSISPQGAHYPPILICSSTRDDRVHPGHARKFYARIHEFGFPAFYYEKTDGGHAGAVDNAARAQLAALRYAFLWHYLSVNSNQNGW